MGAAKIGTKSIYQVYNPYPRQNLEKQYACPFSLSEPFQLKALIRHDDFEGKLTSLGLATNGSCECDEEDTVSHRIIECVVSNPR